MKLSNKKNIGWWLLTVALVIGLVLRFYKLGKIPTSLYWDETAIGYDAFALTQWGKDMHGNPGFQAIFPSYGDYKLPMYIWFSAATERFFGPTPMAVRLPSAMAGIGIIIVSYLIAYELFSSYRIAGLTAVVTSVLPIDILFSRTGFEGHLATFFVGLTLYLWLASRKRNWLLFLTSASAAAAVYSYFSARIVIPLAALITFGAFFQQTSWRWKGLAVVSLGIWFVLLLPIFKSPFYSASDQFRMSTTNLTDVGPFALQSNVLREQSGNTFLTRIVYHRRLLQAKAILSQIADHADFDYLFVSGDINLRHSTGRVGVMFFWMLPVLVIGVSILTHQAALGCWFFGLWVAFVVPAAIPIEVPHALRSMNTLLLFPIVIAVGIDYVWRRRQFLFLGGVGIIAIIELVSFGHDYITHYPSTSASAWQSGYFEIATYLKQHESEFDSCTIGYPDGRLYLYFLFDHQVDPQKTSQAGNQFMIDAIGKYQFKSVHQLPHGARSWVAVDQITWIHLGQPPAVTITDFSGTPQFYVITGISK